MEKTRYRYFTELYWCKICNKAINLFATGCCPDCGATWLSGSIEMDMPIKHKLVKAEKSWKRPWTWLRRNKWVPVERR